MVFLVIRPLFAFSHVYSSEENYVMGQKIYLSPLSLKIGFGIISVNVICTTQTSEPILIKLGIAKELLTL